jgi:Domain of unknown function (DUF4234)
MAEQLSVRGVDVKIRNPWGVFLLALVTFGIYYLVWYYKINRELRDYGRATDSPELGDSPLISLLAISIGWVVVIPPFVSIYRTFGRIATAQRVAGIAEEASPLLGLGLFGIGLLFVPIELVYAQMELNKIWQNERDAVPAVEAAPAPPAA